MLMPVFWWIRCAREVRCASARAPLSAWPRGATLLLVVLRLASNASLIALQLMTLPRQSTSRSKSLAFSNRTRALALSCCTSPPYAHEYPYLFVVRAFRYTQRGGVRPFGLCCLIAGFTDAGEGQLWHTDPTGVYSRWAVSAKKASSATLSCPSFHVALLLHAVQANAVGRNSKSLVEFLEARYSAEMSEEETVKLAVQTLLEVRATAGLCHAVAVVAQICLFTRPVQIVESGAKSMELAVLKSKEPIKFYEEAELTPIVAALEAQAEAEAKAKEAAE